MAGIKNTKAASSVDWICELQGIHDMLESEDIIEVFSSLEYNNRWAMRNEDRALVLVPKVVYCRRSLLYRIRDKKPQEQVIYLT